MQHLPSFADLYVIEQKKVVKCVSGHTWVGDVPDGGRGPRVQKAFTSAQLSLKNAA